MPKLAHKKFIVTKYSAVVQKRQLDVIVLYKNLKEVDLLRDVHILNYLIFEHKWISLV